MEKTAAGETCTVPLVLSTRERTALNRNCINVHVWKPSLTSASLQPSGDNGMHALRQYYASVLLDAGESIKAVSHYLGTSTQVPPCAPTHLMPSSTERTKSAVNAAMAVALIPYGVPRLQVPLSVSCSTAEADQWR